MNIPENLRYTEDHEWVRIEGNRAYVGITDFAQKELGDIVFLELPDLDTDLAAGDQLGVVESVKAIADIHSPVSGIVVEINEALEDTPELINEDAYDTWIAVIEMSNPNEFDSLLTAEQYKSHVQG
ncbi:MAG TPA: glycine cleavage system protein GcvH [Firmicutes bacterium]|jgi:glycine cleavage system H protein|nr:glycine cleavage system protein GcvH [Bacillota bacterium]